MADRLQQGNEAGLPEVMLGVETLANPQFTHYGEADASGRGDHPLLITPNTEEH